VSSTRLPALVDGIQTCPCAERLQTGRCRVCLLELVEGLGQVGLVVSLVQSTELA
jgi:hypothetical protein